ncbi:MAG: M20/M25/M40 family metallo-hydrolase [Bacteroidota bacterium]|nr:M20/M25/M40 family metallo-hydrolase [Candidatus Kapabacteria bacterium]MDW8220411.1 M20/M25/M40 family metallo-hydrolase [Bacteroidota bacterium]
MTALQESSKTTVKVDPRIVEIFREVAVIPALSGRERPMADYIHNFISRLGLTSYEDNTFTRWNGDAGNILCPVAGGGNFIMTAHMDTPRPTADTKVIIDDEKITSDGTTALGVDNRAGVAILLYTLEKVVKENLPTRGFTIAFTTCEETTLDGSMHIPLRKEVEMAFVFDSSMRPGNFVCSSCGAIAFKATFLGKASHSGIAPEKGINAVLAAAKAITSIPLGRVDDTTTVNVGMIHGGEAVNVVPAQATLEGEVRSMDLERIEALSRTIHERFEASAREVGAELEFTARWDFTPYHITPEDRIFQEISHAIEKAGLKPQPYVSWGGSDANSFNRRGIKAVNIGIGAQNPHANTEFIYLEDLQKSADIALEIIREQNFLHEPASR